jgi:AraC-like DNA-binding protein
MLIDLLFFASIVVLALTTLVIVFRIKIYNSYPILLLVLYFLGVISILAAYLVFKYFPDDYPNLPTKFILVLLISSTVVFVYLYLRVLFKNEVFFRKSDLWHLLPIFLLLFVEYISFLGSDQKEMLNSTFVPSNHPLFVFKNGYLFFGLTFILRVLHGMVYLFFAWRLCFKFAVMPSNRKYLKLMKIWVFALISSRTLIFICFTGAVIFFKMEQYFLGDILKILGAVSIIMISTFLLLNPEILFNLSKISIEKIDKAILEDDATSNIYAKLNALINDQKLYLDPAFSSANLAKASKVSVVNIRDVIAANGFDNFSAYLNSFKLTHAESLIKNNYLDDYSIESLSKQSGFNSEVTFYRVFKKKNACTPKEFLKKGAASKKS